MSTAPQLAQRIAQALPQGLGAAAVPPQRPYQIDTAFIPWAHQAALLEDFARHRGLDTARWLAEAGVQRGQVLSPRQMLALLAPLQALGRDSAFVLGQLALPGHYGLPSQALQAAENLLQALRLLTTFAARLSPLLTPRLVVHEQELLLYWTEAIGLPPTQRNFLVDLSMSAVTAFAQWQSGRHLPWCYSFNRTRPADISQPAAYLGSALQFDCHVDAMRLDLSNAQTPWPSASGVGMLDLPALAALADPQSLQRGLRAALYDHLLSRAPEPSSLDEAATHFGVSPATLKRHLALHHTQFQTELDTVRTHLALFMLSLEGRSNEAVAYALGFHDSSNFRRSFKRWTGLTPGVITSHTLRSLKTS